MTERRNSRNVAWILASTALLVVCFLGYVYVASLVAGSRAPEEDVRKLQTALALYARIVLLKGLLPATAISFLLWLGIDRLMPLRKRSIGVRLLVTAGCTGLASLAVAATLMPNPWLELPAVRFTGVSNFVATTLQLAGGIGAAMIVSRVLIDRRCARPRGTARI